MTARRITAVFVALAAILGSAVVRADDPAPPAAEPSQEEVRFRALIRDAVTEYEAGNNGEALSLFQQAYALRPTARVLRGIAKARFELRMYAATIDAIDRALVVAIDPLPETLRDEMVALRERASRFTGTLTIEVEPAAATVLLDGKPLEGTTQVLDAGNHVVEASAHGRRTVRRVVEVAGAGTATIRLVLDRLPPPSATVVVHQTVVEEDATPLYVVGALGLAAAGGVVASALWLVDRNGAVDQCNQAADAGAFCDNADQIVVERDAAIGVIASTAALCAGAAVAFGVLAAGDGGEEPAEIGCGAGADGVACSVGWRW
jgi:hypothetical protein